MNLLIVGSGGREHALAWKAVQSPLLERLFIAPGNPGTASLGENVPISAEGAQNHALLAEFALQKQVHLVIIGPEAPLAEGLTDRLRAAGIAVFGPSQAAAQIEASKVYSKNFMVRHGIPTARFAFFNEYSPALAYFKSAGFPLVIKASGLAAGKGVVLPESPEQAEEALRAMLLEEKLGEAGAQVILEERLPGQEISLLAFTDGLSVRLMPPAQDHKRLLDGNRGPNTGGMGAFAPATVCSPALADEIERDVLQRAVAGLRAENRPFVGVLYAGMILTPEGPKVLEFNCRFGDPETQALMPLLETDLLEVIQACTQGTLEACEIRWKPGAAACVVAASPGYPAKAVTGSPIHGIDRLPTDTFAFQAGTKLVNGELVTAGGRVLGLTGWGKDLPEALRKAYLAVEKVSFPGMQYRKDIGIANISPSQSPPAEPVFQNAYAHAGVSIDHGNQAVELMRQAVQSTYNHQVLAGIGAFGGLFDANGLQAMLSPVLVASTDGVGTKVRLAAEAGSYISIGIDLVNHCINDILVQGARPLFFLDYFASSQLEPQVVAQAVEGIAQACREAGCALLGGETAEMPGVYEPGAFDLAGTIVGVVEKNSILPSQDLQPGDILLGLRSSGPHTNGYSLIRKIFAGISLDTIFPELGQSLGEALLAPHRSYLPLLWPVLSRPGHPVKALAHLTGGSFIENIPRVLPKGVGAVVEKGSWTIPPIFSLVQQRGHVSEQEMYRVFNLGIGMVIACAAQDVPVLQQAIPEETLIIGKLVPGERRVTLR
jgi:phosphoribosylamine--glycine ligase/phosphoribosylformylglycinamidine cyclo-ligase